jgi:hypothetical protein
MRWGTRGTGFRPVTDGQDGRAIRLYWSVGAAVVSLPRRGSATVGPGLLRTSSRAKGNVGMSLFTPNKDFRVRGLVLKLINSNCPSLRAEIDDTRFDSRVNLAVVVTVIPIKDGQVQMDEAFTTVTKDFSSAGLAMVLYQPLGIEQAILGFRMGEDMAFVRAEARHLNPMGGDFFQLGFQLLEVVSAGDYPGLESVRV